MIDKEKLLARRKKNKEQKVDKTLKRVYCLYRVSNKNQVYDDDIPMQKKACHEFVQSQFGWVKKKEIEEKGISGFSVSADDRDAIVQLKDAAQKSKFDVLLVFMFDRLGRIENETPLVLRWFVEHGVEVWSVKEGQQKFDSDEDDLINYIRFWAAETESKKTSIRVKTRLHQKVEEGAFIGGKLPFGYEWTVTDEFNRRGFPVRRPSVIDKEACIVKTLFDKTINDGEGPTALANYVNSKNIKTHAGARFTPSTVTAILKNPLYCGFYVRGNTISPRHEDLQIIDDEVYEKAQIIVNQRSKKKMNTQLDEKEICYPNVVIRFGLLCSVRSKNVFYNE